MSRDPRLYLEEIISAADAVSTYLSGLDYPGFLADRKTQDAVLRNLVLIGEAVKRLPAELTNRHATIEWRRIAGMRDMLVHQYFSTDLQIVWDAAANRLPSVRSAVQQIMDSLR
jgi:uncharacterized protein with HEPN domain